MPLLDSVCKPEKRYTEAMEFQWNHYGGLPKKKCNINNTLTVAFLPQAFIKTLSLKKKIYFYPALNTNSKRNRYWYHPASLLISHFVHNLLNTEDMFVTPLAIHRNRPEVKTVQLWHFSCNLVLVMYGNQDCPKSNFSHSLKYSFATYNFLFLLILPFWYILMYSWIVNL